MILFSTRVLPIMIHKQIIFLILLDLLMNPNTLDPVLLWNFICLVKIIIKKSWFYVHEK